jgi:hypothetical protein
MNKYLFLFLILVISLGVPFLLNVRNPLDLLEGFTNAELSQMYGKYPCAQKSVLVQDVFPSIGKNMVSDNNSIDIWRDYPVFELGSYSQITNNLRHVKNPDNGTCTPASMCGALYRNRTVEDNYIEPLPPISFTKEPRVNFFVAKN